MSAAAASPAFSGWRVVWAAFVVAVFGWGVGFYGPPVFLFAVHEARGWSIPLVSAAVTCHFLLGSIVVANLPAIHRRFSVPGVTRLGGVLSGAGVLGWALATSPWQLFAATTLSGAGWAMTGAAAINAIVSPWFIRRRPAALSTAYNGASVGGVVLSPLWVMLIAAIGFPATAALVGGTMVAVLWWLSGRYLAHGPDALGQQPDGDAAPVATTTRAMARHSADARCAILWRERRFLTLMLGSTIGLFAQVGLIAHLLSMLVAPLGAQRAGLVAGMMTVCAIIGRTGMGWVLRPGVNRRHAAAGNYALQLIGSLVLLSAGGTDVTLLLLGIALFGLGLGNATSHAAADGPGGFRAGRHGARRGADHRLRPGGLCLRAGGLRAVARGRSGAAVRCWRRPSRAWRPSVLLSGRSAAPDPPSQR